MGDSAVVRFLKELRRRRVLRTAGLYVVGAWLALQAATMLFPGWGVPGEAIRFLFWAILLGFPVALVFGWIFEITPDGIQRTRPVDTPEELAAALPLGRRDYLILAAFLIVIGLIVVDATGRVLRTAPVDGEGPYPRLAELVENSLAVLPFASLSADPEHEYFADGISEEILNRLSTFGELQVIARTSSFVFKDSGYDIARISGLLGVEYLLQGSVRRDRGQIRVSAQLVDRKGMQVWTQTFDREPGGIFAIQDEIAEAVASSIVPRIVPRQSAARQPDLAAYEQYLLGREILVRRLHRFPQRSAEHFTRAIELDPEFADAYAERAIALTFEDAHAQAQRDIDTALALNPDLARAFAAQALLLWMREPDALAEREVLLHRALALDPNMVDGLNWLAIVQYALGRPAEAEQIHLRAIRVDPFAPAVNINLAWRDAHRGNFAEAERRLLRQLEIPQATPGYYQILFWLYRHAGRLVEHVEITKRAVLASIELNAPVAHLELAVAYAALGMWDRAEYWQARAERTWPEIYLVRLSRIRVDSSSGRLEVHEAPGRFREKLAEAGVELSRIPRFLSLVYGDLQAMAGEYEGAIETLEPLIDPEDVRRQFLGPPDMIESNARHALAWAWLQTGADDKAAIILRSDDEMFGGMQAEGRLTYFSNASGQFARNTLLLGNADRALELLDQAADAGWREYYLMIHDPRWASVHDKPKFREIMARVKADIDLQRARMEEIDAADDFIERLDAVLAATEARTSQKR
jgi:TolB-like protein/tetratricopeptide (TPR) repeat protein